MSDILDRLRASNSAGMLCDEAAGEIEWLRQEHERLRSDNERLRAALDEINMASFPLERESVRVLCVPIGAWDNAMRALESK